MTVFLALLSLVLIVALFILLLRYQNLLQKTASQPDNSELMKKHYSHMMEQLKTQHSQAINQLQHSHTQKLAEHQNSHSQKISELQNSYSQTLTQIQHSHSQQISEVQQNIVSVATERFQEWRQNECEAIKIKERELALQEASNHLELWKSQSETNIRTDAIQRSQSVILGKVTEHLLPYMADFPYNPRDVKFMGSPIDLIVFDGMTEGDIKQIVLIEVKTGQSASLTPRERQIRNVIKNKNVTWSEMRINRMSACEMTV